MKNEDLRNRWMPGVGAKALMRIHNAFETGGVIPKDISPFVMWEGRIDLRGIILKEGVFYRNFKLKDADLSSATLAHTGFENCVFENVLFDSANLDDMWDHGNVFSNCSFVSTSCRACGIGYKGSKYNNCKFVKTNFKDAGFIRAEMNNCIFDNCNLKRIRFKATSFEDCVFIGKLVDTWFQGGYAFPEDEKDYGKARKNRMKNVSFAKATLRNVHFSDDCDLSTVIMPETGNYRRYTSWKKRLRALQKDIRKWPEEQQERALIFVESALEDAENWYILNVDVEIAWLGEIVGKKVIAFLDNYKE